MPHWWRYISWNEKAYPKAVSSILHASVSPSADWKMQDLGLGLFLKDDFQIWYFLAQGCLFFQPMTGLMLQRLWDVHSNRRLLQVGPDSLHPGQAVRRRTEQQERIILHTLEKTRRQSKKGGGEKGRRRFGELRWKKEEMLKKRNRRQRDKQKGRRMRKRKG